jgi:hypothetical protein
MKPILMLTLAALALSGCGRPVTRLDKLSRVQAAVLTDANGLGTGGTGGGAIQITDPDRLAALESFMTSHRVRWKKADGMPRPTRFQLLLIGGDEPLYTFWLEPGYAAMAQGKKIQEARLSNAETAELMACLGLPPDYMGPLGLPAYPGMPPAMADSSTPQWGVAPASGEAHARSSKGAASL